MATHPLDSLVCPSNPMRNDGRLTEGVAVENLVPYSLSQPAVFKKNQLTPVTDLKLLVRDYEVCLEPPIYMIQADCRSK
jgi:hypothetical protein